MTQVSAAPGDTLTAYYFLRDDQGAPSPQQICGFEGQLVGTKSLTLIEMVVDQGLDFLDRDLPLPLRGPQSLYAEFSICDVEPPRDFLFALVVVIADSTTRESDWLVFWPEEVWPEQFTVSILCECVPYRVCASGLPVLPPGFLEIHIDRVGTEERSWGSIKARFQ